MQDVHVTLSEATAEAFSDALDEALQNPEILRTATRLGISTTQLRAIVVDAARDVEDSAAAEYGDMVRAYASLRSFDERLSDLDEEIASRRRVEARLQNELDWHSRDAHLVTPIAALTEPLIRLLRRRRANALQFRVRDLQAAREQAELLRNQQFLTVQTSPDYEAVAAHFRSAWAQYRKAVLEKGLLPQLRSSLNLRLDSRYNTSLEVEEAPGLSELHDHRFEIPTTSMRQIEYLISSMPGGSIGIHGPRGAGKTTVIRSFCEGRRRSDAGWIATMVACPVGYESREFILHLFSRFCDEVLKHCNDSTKSGPASSRSVTPREAIATTAGYAMQAVEPISQFAVIAGLSLVLGSRGIIDVPPQTAWGLAALGIAFTIYRVIERWRGRAISAERNAVRFKNDQSVFEQDLSTQPRRKHSLAWFTLAVLEPLRTAALFAGLLLVFGAAPQAPSSQLARWGWAVIGLGIFTLRVRASWQRDVGHVNEMRRDWIEANDKYALWADAHRWLQSIRFQQSFSAGWSGSLKLPIGIESAIESTKTFAEQQMSLPDIIDAFRRFVAFASTCLDTKVLIGIDELDKMSSIEDIHAFVSDIKAVFGIDNCFFLVSVSEDAAVNFERRGMPFRDAFDSSFDEIVQVCNLTMAESHELLSRRIVDLPLVFSALCHCLAGGLPRDLIRYCRSLVAFSSSGEVSSIESLTQLLVASEVEKKTKAILSATVSSGTAQEGNGTAMRAEALVFDASCSKTLLAQCDEFARAALATTAARRRCFSDSPRQDHVARLYGELAAYYYFCSTMLEFFNRTLTRDRIMTAESALCKSRSFDALANARSLFVLEHAIAWSAISEFRRSWGLTELSL